MIIAAKYRNAAVADGLVHEDGMSDPTDAQVMRWVQEGGAVREAARRAGELIEDLKAEMLRFIAPEEWQEWNGPKAKRWAFKMLDGYSRDIAEEARAFLEEKCPK